MKRRWVILLVLGLGSVASRAGAQQEAELVFDGLTFGVSGKDEVEKVYGGRLGCMSVAEEIEHCVVLGSVYLVEAAFAQGALRYLRMLLPYGVFPEAVAADLRGRWGPVVAEGTGNGRSEGLRYWVYRPIPGGSVLLEEVRNRLNGQERLRLTLLDGRGDWFPR